MPTNALDWNHVVEFDSKESIFDTLSKHYVDPWDLENYAYIREHLDSLELSSQSSSFSESIEANYPEYSPSIPSKSRSSIEKPKFDSLLESDYGTAKYAEIEDVYKKAPSTNTYQRKKKHSRNDHNANDLYGIANFGLESDNEEDTKNYYGVSNRRLSTALYESNHQYRFRNNIPNTKRRMSYNEDIYGYSLYNSPQSIYKKINVGRKSQSEQYMPIYDKIRSSTPNHFGLSNYGHLQIDYSSSWNILDKYICN